MNSRWRVIGGILALAILVFGAVGLASPAVVVTNVNDPGTAINWEGLDTVEPRYITGPRDDTGLLGDPSGNMEVWFEDRTAPKTLVHYTSTSGYTGLTGRTSQSFDVGTVYGHPFIYKDDSTFHSWWYDSSQSPLVYKIKHYTSTNGNSWTREDPDVTVLKNLTGGLIQSFGIIDILPYAGGYRMYYQVNSGQPSGGYQSIHTSTNTDLNGTWTYEGLAYDSNKYNLGFSPTGNVYKINDNLYLMFLVPETESGLFLASSIDGLTFAMEARILPMTAGDRTRLKEGTVYKTGQTGDTYHFGFLYDGDFTGHVIRCLGYSTFDIVISEASQVSICPWEFDLNDVSDLAVLEVDNYINSMDIETSTDKVVGSGSVKVSGNLTGTETPDWAADSAFHIRTHYISIDGNTEYNWYSLVKSTHDLSLLYNFGLGQNYTTGLLWYDSNKDYISQTRYDGYDGRPRFHSGAATNWTPVNHKVTSPANAEYVRIQYGLDHPDMYTPEYWQFDLIAFAETDEVWVNATGGSDDYPGTQNYPFATIQAGINAVSSGGTVHVASGTYSEHITIGKSLTLQAGSAPIIDGSGTGTAVTIDASNVMITGFTIQNAATGIAVTSGTGNLIHFCNIVNNTTWGLNNTSGNLVDAEHNYWGDGGTGAEHGKPGVGGNNPVSANVDYDPWIQFALAADPNQLVVGGNSTLTARFQDSNDVVPAGIDQLPLYQEAKKATFETNLGTLGSTTITKGLIDGQATATLTSTTCGTATVTAQAKDAGDNLINGTQDTTTVEFLAAASGTIELAADPLNIVADGSSTSTITATVRDGCGNLVANGTNVTFTTDRGTMASTHPTTNGVAQATLTSGTEAGVATVNAQANGASADIAVFFKEPDGADVSGAKTEKTEPGDDTVDAKDETGCEIDKSGDGTPTITSARYEGNPGGTPCFSAHEGSYFDVHLDDSTGVDEIVIRYYYPTDVDESSLVMYWWDGSYWQICSDFWVNTTDTNGYGGYMAARITATSTPNLDDLSGQAFAAGVAAESVFKHRYYDKSGYWMISLPFTPDPTNPVQLKDDLLGEIYTYDPAVGDYVVPTELRMGQAYWAWFDGTTDIDVTGHKFSGSPQRINCAVAGWHMIGPAFLRSPGETVCWGEVWVEHDGETVSSVRAAAELGWLKSFVFGTTPMSRRTTITGAATRKRSWCRGRDTG